MTQRPEVPPHIVSRVGELCLALPEAYEEDAWAGTRWCIRKRNFAHVVQIDAGLPAAYASVAGTDGPATILTFRAPLEEVDAFAHVGAPYFLPGWWPDIVGMVVDDDADWEEIGELVTESYCLLAPKKLAALVAPPPR
jgi:hypothetical protein